MENTLVNNNIESAYRKKIRENCIFEENYVKVPIYNKHGDIVEYTLVDLDDFEKVMKVLLHFKINTDEYKSISATLSDKKKIQLSHYIYKKPKVGYIIDHKNNNGLDNRKINLHEITNSQNSQNKKKTTKNTSSNYIGVSRDTINNKWVSRCSGKALGRFDNELDAAIMYDKYSFVKFGKHASNNNVVKYDEISNLTLEDIKPSRKKRDLPDNIYTENNLFYAEIVYKKKRYKSKFVKKIDDAINFLDTIMIEVNKIKEIEEKEHLNKIITRDINGNAIINIYKNKEFVAGVIVDDDKWYELSKYSWFLHNGYVGAYINKKRISMHRYLMNAEKGIFIDHYNNNSLDNRVKNLRIATAAQNSYNKSQSNHTLHKYKGLSYDKKCKTYKSTIRKDGKEYYLGNYKTEVEAAIAYNLKAIVLFEDFARLNIIDISDELQQEYKNSILEKWKKQNEIVNTKGTFLKSSGRYQSKITINRITYSLGTYKTLTEAAIAYNVGLIIILGEEIAKPKINTIDIDLYNKYKDEIYTKIKPVIENKQIKN